VTIPVGLVAVVFAYSFRKRKAACDAVIDDPPRRDYRVATRPQRGWFKPESLAGQLTEVHITLARSLAEGDALLRATVRADERAQGAFRDGHMDLAEWQGGLSDSFFDEYISTQFAVADLAAAVSSEILAEPDFRSVRPTSRRLGLESPLSELLTLAIRARLSEAGVSTIALREMLPREPVSTTLSAADVVAHALRQYSEGGRERTALLSESRSSRSSVKDRVRLLERRESGQMREE
jgi:hypothetical protein